MYLQFTDVGKGNPNVVQLRVWIWPFLIQNPIFFEKLFIAQNRTSFQFMRL